MKVRAEIRGCIEIPDSWANSANGMDIMEAIDTADYHFNDKLDVDDAINLLAAWLKKYPDDFEVSFDTL